MFRGPITNPALDKAQDAHALSAPQAVHVFSCRHKCCPLLQVRAEDPVYALAACDLTESDDLVWDIARHLPSIRWLLTSC